jgi:putative ABC transport system permease protein
MAPRAVVNSLSRTAIAVAALMVAVSVTIGVSLMIGSFRYTVQVWLEQVLQGDIYISAPGLIATQPSAPLDARIPERLADHPGVKEVFTLQAVSVDSPYGPVQVNASSNVHVAEQRLYLWQQYEIAQMESEMLAGAVVVSEPFANRIGLPRQGGEITLFTDRGEQTFPVIGVYYDYSSTQGTVLMQQSVYHRYWDDRAINAMSLMVESGSDVDALAARLQDELSDLQRLVVRPNQALRREVFAVFDRTFAITQALQLLATVVAFIGVLSALLSLELERQRELGILRAVGLTGRQLWGLVLLETGMLGSAAGLLAMPTGYVLSLILVHIINKRSFGWTLQLQLGPDPFIQAALLAVSAAVLAGVYPAWRMARMVTAEAMRFES